VQILQQVRTCSPDVLLVSAQLEGDVHAGFSVLTQLRTEHPDLKAVVLLDSSKPDAVVAAFRCGARGVFCRNVSLDLLGKCVSAVHRGEIWANNQELSFLLAALAETVPVQFDTRILAPLSAREVAVVRCLVEGLTNREIAQILSISQHTVKNYIFKIFDKLGVSNRIELVFHVLATRGHTRPMESFEGRKHPVKAPSNTTSDEVQFPAVRGRRGASSESVPGLGPNNAVVSG
jgi:DNA-binding NarL/FixJ family response regulator